LNDNKLVSEIERHYCKLPSMLIYIWLCQRFCSDAHLPGGFRKDRPLHAFATHRNDALDKSREPRTFALFPVGEKVCIRVTYDQRSRQTMQCPRPCDCEWLENCCSNMCLWARKNEEACWGRSRRGSDHRGSWTGQ